MGRARDEYHPGVDVSIMNDEVAVMEWAGEYHPGVDGSTMHDGVVTIGRDYHPGVYINVQDGLYVLDFLGGRMSSYTKYP